MPFQQDPRRTQAPEIHITPSGASPSSSPSPSRPATPPSARKARTPPGQGSSDDPLRATSEGVEGSPVARKGSAHSNGSGSGTGSVSSSGSRTHVQLETPPPATRRSRSQSREDKIQGHKKRASFAIADDGDGDEEGDDEDPSQSPRTTVPSSASVSASKETGEELQKRGKASTLTLLAKLRMERAIKHKWFSWIAPKLNWKGMKPVLRCAVASWLGLVLLLIVSVEKSVGQAAFFLLVVAFMLPPASPLIQSLETYLNLFFFTGIAWAWVALGVFVAGKTRVPTDPAKIAAAEAKWAYLGTSTTAFRAHVVYEGTYLQAKPAVVCSVFLSAGTGAFLWWKLKTQPSPATFPLVLSCILIDIGLTTAVFYPYNLYTSGLLFFLPMAIQAGLGIVSSLLIFPESVGHSFQSKFPGILNPLSAAMKSIEALFDDAKLSDAMHNHDTEESFLSVSRAREHEQIHADKLNEWADRSKVIRSQLLASLAGLPPLRAQQRYLSIDFSYSRLSGEDLRELFDHLALVQARSGGMAFFFDVIVTNARHSHLDSSAWSVHQVNQSRPGSRAASIRNLSIDEGERNSFHEGNQDDDSHSGRHTPPLDHYEDVTEDSIHDRNSHSASKRIHLPGFFRRNNSGLGFGKGHHGSHQSLLESLRKVQQPVGVYESTRYMDVERSFMIDAESALEQLDILARTSLPVIRGCELGLSAVTDWILNVNRDRRIIPRFHRHTNSKAEGELTANGEKRAAIVSRIEDATANLQSALDDFCVTRLEVIKPYKHLFDPAHPAEEGAHHKMHYRGLFQNFVAQYHLIEFSQCLLKLLRSMEELDRARPRRQFWYPHLSTLLAHLRNSHHEKSHLTDGDEGDDNDAAFAQESDDTDWLGEARKRNPEYKPFDSAFLNFIASLTKSLDLLSSRSFMYAIKAAVLGALTSLPNFIASSSSFYYYNRGIWCTIMAQLTLAVYSGDTTVAWLGRVVASFWGCLLGMVAWYIGSGSGQGNPYGLAAVGAVTFPLAMFFRVHFPGPILTSVMTTVTFGLVIGYSYYNGTIGPLTYAEWGWDVAWRRFVCVLIGITAAWIFSFIPPVYSAKRAVRHSYAQTIGAGGTILCDVLSHANDHHYHLKDSIEIRQKLITWRSKLNKLGARHANASFEYSLRGRWPEERYKALLDTLQDTFSLLSQLNHVLTQLDRPWRKALLDRTRLSDPVFLGDVLSVLSMCSTALRAGTALPQITPSPLVARFRMGKTKGLDLPHDPSETSGDLPTLVTVDVLESDNYMRYALGITTTFSLISRLDRIVVICKTLLGENFHISGLHLEQNRV